MTLKLLFVCAAFCLVAAGQTVQPSSPGAAFAIRTASVLSGTYTSGITATGTIGQTCNLGTFNGGGSATATVALTGTDTIAGSTVLVITDPGSLFTSSPTTAVASAGTAATCTGTATIATVLRISDPGGLTTQFFLPVNSSELLPSALQGMGRCYTSNPGVTSAVTIAVATGNTIALKGVNGTTTTGTLVSGGAAGDSICLLADANNHWNATIQVGTWTNN